MCPDFFSSFLSRLFVCLVILSSTQCGEPDDRQATELCAVLLSTFVLLSSLFVHILKFLIHPQCGEPDDKQATELCAVLLSTFVLLSSLFVNILKFLVYPVW